MRHTCCAQASICGPTQASTNTLILNIFYRDLDLGVTFGLEAAALSPQVNRLEILFLDPSGAAGGEALDLGYRTVRTALR